MIIPFRSAMISGLLVVALTACSEDLPSVPPPLTPASVEAAVARGEGTDPALYAGDFSVKAPFDIPAEKAPVPVVLYSGLSPEGETRLKIRSFVDLRQMQQQLPELLSGVVVDNCKHQFALDFTAADAQANDIRAWGTVNAKFFRCKGEDDDIAARGRQFLAPSIDAFAVASAEVVDQCVVIRLRDIQLNPRGFLGGVANLFGLTAIARSVILKEGAELLAEKPVCPTLPAELAPLAPRYDTGGVLEVGEGGIGAELSGSVDTSASTLIKLLTVIKEQGVLEEIQ